MECKSFSSQYRPRATNMSLWSSPNLPPLLKHELDVITQMINDYRTTRSMWGTFFGILDIDPR